MFGVLVYCDVALSLLLCCFCRWFDLIISTKHQMISTLNHLEFSCNLVSETRLLNQRSAQNLTYSTHFLGHYIVFLFFELHRFCVLNTTCFFLDVLDIQSRSMFYFLSDFCAASVRVNKKERKCCSRDRCWVLEQLTEPCFTLKYPVHRPGFSPFSADLQQCCRFYF